MEFRREYRVRYILVADRAQEAEDGCGADGGGSAVGGGWERSAVDHRAGDLDAGGVAVEEDASDPGFEDGQEAQAIRIGIRQLYLAGYDIREAPFAWTVAQRKPVPNPIIDSKDPDEEIPWYSSYAFDYISKYYSDVDYSKLKRGEAEYQQFLEELRKADPEAFEQSK